MRHDEVKEGAELEVSLGFDHADRERWERGTVLKVYGDGLILVSLPLGFFDMVPQTLATRAMFMRPIQ